MPRHVLGGPGHTAPSEKTTLAGIGMGANLTSPFAERVSFVSVSASLVSTAMSPATSAARGSSIIVPTM